MTSSVLELNNPFSRHQYLPTAMNWLNKWDAQTLYFNNDIVISPITSSAYILFTEEVSIIGGGDPSTNPSWFLFADIGDQVVNIRTGDGIGLSGGPTNPTMDNSGVIFIQLGNSLQNIGTNTNLILENIGVDTVTGILGIDTVYNPITRETTINNVGVSGLSASPSSGISLSSNTGEVQITNNGVLSLVSTDANLTVTGGVDKLVTNNGLLDIAITGAGLANTGTATSPIFSNLGVIDISGNNSIIFQGTTGDVKLGTNLSKVCLVFPTLSLSPINWNVGTEGIIPVQNPLSLFSQCLSTGLPHSTGTFVITLPITYFISKYTGISQGATITFAIIDTVNSKRYSVIPIPSRRYNAASGTGPISPAYTTILNIVIDLAAIRAAGVRQFNQLGITFLNVAVPSATAKISSSGGPCFAVYYPQSL